MKRPTLRPVIWLVDTRKTLKGFPQDVQDEIGYGLYLAQIGEKHVRAKPLKGLGSGVMELVSDHRGDTFRGVYTVRFADSVYVLHVFQKKSRKGSETPQSEIELVRQRLTRAGELHEQRER
jgi:phage-related protein